MLKFALYPSNHGYGHASRIAALAEALNSFGIFTYIRTNRPRFLFGQLDNSYHELSETNLDFGVRHKENLRADLDRTRSDLLDLMSNRVSLVENEVDFLISNGVDLVIVDAVFLAIDAASYAGVPCFVISNFDWHFIYSEIFAGQSYLKPLLNTIYGLYQRADRAYSLPFSDAASTSAFSAPVKLGLLARKKDRYNDVRTKHGISESDTLVISSHGGEGSIDLGISSLCETNQVRVVSTDASINSSMHSKIEPEADFLDYIHAADIILTKPGYSSLAEAVQFGKPIVYRQRTNYPEERVLVKGLNSYKHAYDMGEKQVSKDLWKELLRRIQVKRETCKKKASIKNANEDIAARLVRDYLEVGKRGDMVSVYDLGSNNLNYSLYDSLSDKLVHSHQLSIGLAKGMHEGILTASAIQRAKKAIRSIHKYDIHIRSRKAIFGTQACRESLNLAGLEAWLHGKSLSLKVINSKLETQLVYYSVKNHLDPERLYLCVDIGGASTEFALVSKKRFIKGISLAFGLLRMSQKNQNKMSTAFSVSSELEKLDFEGDFSLLAIGLSPAFLLKVVMKSESFIHSNELLVLHRKDLVQLMRTLESDDAICVEKWLPELGNLSILSASCRFMLELLDRYSQDQILVSTNGISLGYARSIIKKV